MSPFGAGSRRAFLVPHSLTFGLARMYKVFQSPSGAEICAFQSADEAKKWLEFDDKIST